MKKGALLAGMIVMQSACMATYAHPQFNTIEPGDQNLGCVELSSEISIMDNYIYEAQKSLRISGYGGTNSGSQRAARDVTESGFGSMSGGDWERQQAQTQQFNLDKAKARRDHLANIAAGKSCL
jgi:hypothetical protein